MRAVIVGAGIGGLAAAVALRRVGVQTVIVERVPDIREVGAGISIWSNAIHAMRELGIDAKVIASASVIERSLSQTLTGRLITTDDFRDMSSDGGTVCICVHRGVLQRILLEALPPGSLRTGAPCVGFDGSTAILEDGERVEGDVLVGADGINSVIRAQLSGAAPPRYAGYTCWRGICRDRGVLPDRSALLALGAGTQFGLVPCGAGQLYWFLTKNAPPGTTGTKEQVVAMCRPWAAPIREIVEGTPEDAIVRNDIFDRPPLNWWGRGLITLLGDAAHATTPNLGQGACQAFEDAVVLADCIRRIQPVELALREYERQRIPRTAMIVRNSWQTGRILQLDRPALEVLRNWFMGTSLGRHFTLRMLQEVVRYRVPQLQQAV
jgi:2-polyprenyl-6-methoxyphenol hydroxylase-like FAD-dependent oxidoreductase